MTGVQTCALPILRLKEHFGSLEDLTIAYIGDGRNNIANSLLVTSAILGVNVKIISPEILQPEADIVELAQKHNNGADLTISIRSHLPVF